jgi:aminopeptidase-like protein
MMAISDLNSSLGAVSERSEAGEEMYRLIAALYPLCRSITGDGVRETLRHVQRHIPLAIHEVPSGTRVFDWTVPREWNIRDAYIKNGKGERIVDFQHSNLHVVSYSRPIHETMPLARLLQHLFSDPAHPDWIPYRTSYYQENWGFCISHNQLLALPEGDYEVCIDSTLEDGALTYGEFFVPGRSSDTVLISCHICHPSLCNDNLSGIAVATMLGRWLAGQTPRYSYCFLFIPGTIGSITWLARNEDTLAAIKHGLIAVNLGDPGPLSYKRSRRGNAEIDRVVSFVLRRQDPDAVISDFVPYGYDERQFCSPAFNLPVGCLMRTPHGQFPEYHTSADNLDLVRPEHLAHSFETYRTVVRILEANRRYRNLQPKCEPQLGRRGLYDAIGGQSDTKQRQLAMLWVLNCSDGEHSLLDIAERSGLAFEMVQEVAMTLEAHALLAAVTDPP